MMREEDKISACDVNSMWTLISFQKDKEHRRKQKSQNNKALMMMELSYTENVISHADIL
jgi:hypothetical protein